MRNLFIALATVLFFELILSQCANPKPPTGGPKDTIPPVLISAYPEDQTLNFNDQTIILTFDEFINTAKLKQNLIITPTSELTYKVLSKKNTVTLRFEEPFADSTTYTLNFFAGVTDITEKTPAENLVLAFSTTSYIDSLSIIGSVQDLMSGARLEKFTVGLYHLTDTLDPQSIKPTYFITTDESGAFKIQNIKQDNYRLLAFNDDNKNLLFDPASEAYAFSSDTIQLTESITDSLRLYALDIDASEMSFISARPSGLYFDVRYNKELVHYEVIFPDDTTSKVAADFAGEGETIRFYNNLDLEENDSIQAILTVYDSLKNNLTDTVYIKFRESSRKPTDYSGTLEPTSGSITSDIRLSLNFNKPTQLITDSSLLYVPVDTLYKIYFDAIDPKFNFNQTSYSFHLPDQIFQDYADTLLVLTEQYAQTDTNNIDTAKLYIYNNLSRIDGDRLALNIRKNAFVSVENDTLPALSGNFRPQDAENLGDVKITLTTDYPSYTVQLMENDAVAEEQTNCETCNFQGIQPGTYWVRILVDENQDGKWSPGNYQELIEPEPVIYFPEKSELRSNWLVELDYSF